MENPGVHATHFLSTFNVVEMRSKKTRSTSMMSICFNVTMYTTWEAEGICFQFYLYWTSYLLITNKSRNIHFRNNEDISTFVIMFGLASIRGGNKLTSGYTNKGGVRTSLKLALPNTIYWNIDSQQLSKYEISIEYFTKNRKVVWRNNIVQAQAWISFGRNC